LCGIGGLHWVEMSGLSIQDFEEEWVHLVFRIKIHGHYQREFLNGMG
jgi:hypothetical protein